MATDRQIRPHSMAVFRIFFGSLMAVAMIRILANGWVDEFFHQPEFHFSYPGFGWVRPWPGILMELHVAALAVCAIGIAAGIFYRTCTLLFFVGFTYLELIDRTLYLNHYYLVSLLAGSMVFMPADAVWTLGAPRRNRRWIPGWPVWLLRFQFAVVYLFAGIAKLNADWLLAAQPMKIWLAARSDLPVLGPLLEMDGIAHAASWFGALYDLGVPFLLLIRKTRPVAFTAVVVFHVLTWLLFPIGMFPWIMILGATLFFPPEWPLRSRTSQPSPPKAHAMSAAGRGLLVCHVAVQLILPTRGWWSDGNSAWTGKGFNWSWKVMIAEKRGHVTFHLLDHAGRKWRVDPADHLTPRQTMMMAQDPQMIRDFARYLAGPENHQVRADAFATLNGRPSQRLIDPGADLATARDDGWIVPLRGGTEIISPTESRVPRAAVLRAAMRLPTR